MSQAGTNGSRPDEAPRPRGVGWGPLEAWMVLIASELVLIFGGAVAVGTSKDPSVAVQFVGLLPFWVFAVLACRHVVSRGGGDPVVELRLRFRPVDIPIGLVVGLAAQLVLIPLLYWPLLKILNEDTDELERVAQRLGDSATGTLGTVLLIVMTCVMAPVVEEILYRGLLMGALGRRHRVWGLVVSSAVFGLFHFQPLQFAGLFLFGLILGGLVLWTGRLGTAIVTHIVFNATTVAVLLVGR